MNDIKPALGNIRINWRFIIISIWYTDIYCEGLENKKNVKFKHDTRQLYLLKAGDYSHTFQRHLC